MGCVISVHTQLLMKETMFFFCFFLILELPEPPKLCELRNETIFEVVCTPGKRKNSLKFI